MTGGCRAGVVGLLLWLLTWVPANAQTRDSIRVGQEVGNTAVDSTAVGNTVADSTAADDLSEPVVLRTVADSVVRDLQKNRVYAYANDSDYWRWKDSPDQMRTSASRSGRTDRFLGSRAFEYLILILLGGILVYAIVRIILANRLQLFYRSPKGPMVIKSAVEGSPEDDLEGQLMHFMQIKDYRQAVRYLYLKTLRILNDRGLIRYHQEATNDEYWQQLKTTPQGAPFRDLTTIYEKVWYGEFPLGDALFSRLHHYFEDFYKSVRA